MLLAECSIPGWLVDLRRNEGSQNYGHINPPNDRAVRNNCETSVNPTAPYMTITLP